MASGTAQPSDHKPAKMRLPAVGFWSYARQDDDLSDGDLTQLRTRLRSTLQQQIGRTPIEIFQDTSAIPYGAKWEEEIRHSIFNATFFIPILSPNFLQSEWCTREVELFLERQQQLYEMYPDLPRESRVFPICYIDTSRTEPLSPEIAHELSELQVFDYRDLRYEQVSTTRRAVAGFAQSIRDVLLVQVDRPPTPEERARLSARLADEERQRQAEIAAAEERRRAELAAAEQRRREDAEAERLAEEQRLADSARLEERRSADALIERHAAEQRAEAARAAEAAQDRARRERREALLTTVRGYAPWVAGIVAIVLVWAVPRPALVERGTQASPIAGRAPANATSGSQPAATTVRTGAPGLLAASPTAWLTASWGLDDDCSRPMRIVMDADVVSITSQGATDRYPVSKVRQADEISKHISPLARVVTSEATFIPLPGNRLRIDYGTYEPEFSRC